MSELGHQPTLQSSNFDRLSDCSELVIQRPNEVSALRSFSTGAAYQRLVSNAVGSEALFLIACHGICREGNDWNDSNSRSCVPLVDFLDVGHPPRSVEDAFARRVEP
jgi:hypothetical protein